MKKFIVIFCITTLVLVGCTSKPSKESVQESFRKNIIEQLGSSGDEEQEELSRKFADCIVDEVYDKLSAKTAKKFVDAKNVAEFNAVSGTKDEKATLDKAAETCAEDTIAPAGE